MNNNIKILLDLIKENPELPIICMVDSDIIGDDYGRWMAQIGWSEVGEFASYNELWLMEQSGYNAAKSVREKEEALRKVDRYMTRVLSEHTVTAIVVVLRNA